MKILIVAALIELDDDNETEMDSALVPKPPRPDDLLTRLMTEARRGQQFQGSPDSPDVVTDIPNVHIECKRTERFRLYEALEQAIDDAGLQKLPVVCHRQNNKPWVAVLRLDDLPSLIQILHDNTVIHHESETDPTEHRPALDPNGPGNTGS